MASAASRIAARNCTCFITISPEDDDTLPRRNSAHADGLGQTNSSVTPGTQRISARLRTRTCTAFQPRHHPHIRGRWPFGCRDALGRDARDARGMAKARGLPAEQALQAMLRRVLKFRGRVRSGLAAGRALEEFLLELLPGEPAFRPSRA